MDHLQIRMCAFSGYLKLKFRNSSSGLHGARIWGSMELEGDFADHLAPSERRIRREPASGSIGVFRSHHDDPVRREHDVHI